MASVSPNNESIIRHLYDLFKAKDYESIRALLHPDIHWNQMDGFPNGGKRRGPDEVLQLVFGSFAKSWDGWKAVSLSFHAAGDKVFVLGYYEGTYRETGKFMRAEYAHVYTLENGLVTYFQQYTDTKIIVDAMSKGEST